MVSTALAPALWGTTYLVTTELLPEGRPLLTGVLRALPAGAVLALATRRRPSGLWWLRALALGILNIGGFFALLFVAAYRLPGGVAATLGAIQPLLAAALGAAVLRQRLRLRSTVAGLLGLAGVSLLVLRSNATLDVIGLVAGLGGAASMATGVVLTKRWERPVSLLAFTSWQLVAGGLALAPLALAVEGAPPHLTASNLIGYAWLASVGTALAYALWFRGIARLPVAQVSILGLLSPVVATLAGWLALDQSLAPAQMVGAIVVLTAVLIGQTAAEPPHGAHPVPPVGRRGAPPRACSSFVPWRRFDAPRGSHHPPAVTAVRRRRGHCPRAVASTTQEVVASVDPDTLWGMCSRVQCPTCQRPTYAGCGNHVEQVLGDVEPEARCQCSSGSTSAPARGWRSWLTSPGRR